MKQIKVKSISIQNFKGCRSNTISFNESLTTISGQNATGKTTILDAFMWALFNKDSSGTEKFGIRPVDDDGKPIDNIEISVDVKLDVDDIETSFKKTSKQKWTKHRGSSAPTYEGNVNSYEANGFPVTEKEYKAKIAEIISEDDFKLITDIRYFSGLPWKDKKEILLRLCGDVTDKDVIDADPQRWLPIASCVLEAGVEKTRAKTKKELTEYNKRQKELPVRIDELSRQKTDPISVTEMESNLENLKEGLSSMKKEAEELRKASDSTELEQLKKTLERKLADLIDDANRDVRREKEKLLHEVSDIAYQINDRNTKLRAVRRDITAAEKDVEMNTSRLQGLGKAYHEAEGRTFDESSTICRSCGQTLPADKVAELKKKFEETKASDMKGFICAGNQAKDALEGRKTDLEDYRYQESELLKEIDALQETQKARQTALEGLGDKSADLTGNADCEAVLREIGDAENAIKAADGKRQEYFEKKNEVKDLEIRIRNAERAIDMAKAQNAQNDVLAKRIRQLTEDQRDVGQNIATAEQKLILLEEFSMKKSKLLSEKITSQFEFANFSLFNQQINGGITEECEITLKGVKYKDMNSGHRIVVALDIIRTFQNKLGISAPIFIDNSESLNTYNIPKMDCQLILLRVTDDENLTVS